MAVSGILSDYIVRNYKRLLVCVAPPVDSDTDGEEVDDRDTSKCDTSKPVVDVVPPCVSAPPSPTQAPRGVARCISDTSTRPHSMPASASCVVDVSAAACHVSPANQELDPDANEHDTDAENSSRWRRRRSSVRARLPLPRRPRPRSRTQPSMDSHFASEDHLHGCVATRSGGPRSSGDFVVMGCMQV